MMKHPLLRATLAALLVLVCGGLARAQTQRIVVYLQDGKTQIEGTVAKENPAGIQVQLLGRGGVKEIPAADIQQVTYLGKISAADFRRPFTIETKALDA